MAFPDSSDFPVDLDTFLTDAELNGNTQDNIDGAGTQLSDYLAYLGDCIRTLQEYTGIVATADTDSITYKLGDHLTATFPHGSVPEFLRYDPVEEEYVAIDDEARVYLGTVAPDGSNGPYALGDVQLELWVNSTVS